MKISCRLFRHAALLLAFHMLMLSGPYQSAGAAMIRTDAMIDVDHKQHTRQRLYTVLLGEDMKANLESRGVDPRELKARMDSLSDAELERIADVIDQLPAGGGFFETFVVVVFLVFLVLLITDISGHTDVFPFVKKHAATDTTRDQQAVETDAQPQARTRQSADGINPHDNLVVYFDFGSNELSSDALERLDRLAGFMIQNPMTNIKIKGFSDSTGTSSYDRMVSEIRANTVKNYLIAKGIAPSKISTEVGTSQELPAGSAAEEGSAMKGRVIIEFN